MYECALVCDHANEEHTTMCAPFACANSSANLGKVGFPDVTNTFPTAEVVSDNFVLAQFELGPRKPDCRMNATQVFLNSTELAHGQ